MSGTYGVCTKWLKLKHLTKHHIYPKRHYNKPVYCYLCRKCHDALERIITTREKINGKLHRNDYLDIVINFVSKRRDNNEEYSQQARGSFWNNSSLLWLQISRLWGQQRKRICFMQELSDKRILLFKNVPPIFRWRNLRRL